MGIDKQEKRNTLRTPHDSWVTILSFDIVEGKIAEIYADILAAKNDKSAHASFETAGLFFRSVGGNVTQDGTITKPKLGTLNVDVDIVANTTDQTVEIKVQGLPSDVVHWECTAEIRQRADVEDYVGDPRLQVSIVGMRAAKKLGWMGLTDGINYVLTPTTYTHSAVTTGTARRNTENWIGLVSKKRGNFTVTDKLSLFAARFGNSTAWLTWMSTGTFNWFTNTGSFGLGASTTIYSNYRPTADLNGYLKNRMLSHFVTALGVTFLWSRYDVQGWCNYTGGI